MRHGQGTRYNADVHDALAIIKKYNADQEIAEAPYSIGQRVGDTVKGVVPGGMGRMAKGRKESGKMANDVNKQWQSHLGKKGLKDQNAATVQDLSDFIERLAPGTDASAFYQQTGINATDPASTVPKKSQEAIILALAQSMNAGGGGGGTASTAPTATSGGAASAQAGVDFAKRAGGKKAPAVDTDGDGVDDVSGTTIEPQVDTNKDGKDDATGEPITDPTDPTDPTPQVDTNKDGKDDNTGEPIAATPEPEEPADPNDPNTNRVLSPTEVQGPKGQAWKKDTTGQWKKSVHPFTSATPELAAELDKILSSGTKPDAKQTELINFVKAMDDQQRQELKKLIQKTAGTASRTGSRKAGGAQ